MKEAVCSVKLGRVGTGGCFYARVRYGLEMRAVPPDASDGPVGRRDHRDGVRLLPGVARVLPDVSRSGWDRRHQLGVFAAGHGGGVRGGRRRVSVARVSREGDAASDDVLRRRVERAYAVGGDVRLSCRAGRGRRVGGRRGEPAANMLGASVCRARQGVRPRVHARRGHRDRRGAGGCLSRAERADHGGFAPCLAGAACCADVGERARGGRGGRARGACGGWRGACGWRCGRRGWRGAGGWRCGACGGWRGAGGVRGRGVRRRWDGCWRGWGCGG